MLTTEKAATAVDIQIRFLDSAAGAPEGLCEEVAAVTADAYAAGDLVPGLPVADGARERAADVRVDLAAGRGLWVASLDGETAGAVRAVVRPDGDWEVRRLAVSPRVRHAGLGRLLLRRLETAAAAAGARRVVLDAVVERGNPAFYARVGFRTVRHFGAADKPLSEVHMVRDPSAPPEPGRPCAPVGDGRAVSWWAAPDGTLCRTGAPLPEGPQEGLLGIDVLPGTAAARWPEAEAALAARADRRTGDGLFFAGPAARTAAFAQPRLVHPGLLAWWRSPAARAPRP